ncbi:MAG: DUF998 domain-containing protein [Gemmatimonadaceae bacterium]
MIFKRLLGFGGMAGPAVFASVVIAAAMLRSNYSHLTSFISELGASGSPHAALMNYGGFIGGGLLFVLFAVALALSLPRRPLVVLGSGLVTAFGLSLVASGAFPCDPGCPFPGGTIENQIHNSIGHITNISLIVATGIFGIAFGRIAAWRRFAKYSLLTSACAAVFMTALVTSLDTRALTGLWQRLLLATFFLWCGVLGTALYRGRGQAPPPSN